MFAIRRLRKAPANDTSDILCGLWGCRCPNVSLAPCCGYYTLDEEPPGTFLICPVCFWEDDNVQFSDHDYAGGANRVSLNEARKNFREFGASEKRVVKMVRPPQADEMPLEGD